MGTQGSEPFTSSDDRYDVDNDGKLNDRELHDFLIDLAKSRVLPDRIRSKKAATDSTALVPSAATDTKVSTVINTEQPNSTPSPSPSTAVVVPSTSGGVTTPAGSCPELSRELIAGFAQQVRFLAQQLL